MQPGARAFALTGRLLAWPLIGLVQVYRYGVSPLLGRPCRFAPSCSEFAVEALHRHGAWRGGLYTLKRLARCHPWGGSGYDPVPPVRSPDTD